MLCGFAQHAVERSGLVTDGDQIAHRLRKYVGVTVEGLGHAHASVQVVQHVAGHGRHGGVAHAVAFFHQGDQRIECGHSGTHHQAQVTQKACQVFAAHLLAEQMHQGIGHHRQPDGKAPEADHRAIGIGLKPHAGRQVALDRQAQQA